MFDIFILPSQPNDLNPLNETQKKKEHFLSTLLLPSNSVALKAY